MSTMRKSIQIRDDTGLMTPARWDALKTACNAYTGLAGRNNHSVLKTLCDLADGKAVIISLDLPAKLRKELAEMKTSPKYD